MTLVEFIAPLSKGPQKDKILAVLYYRARYEAMAALTVEGIRASLRSARVPGWKRMNIADVLNRMGALVNTPGTEGPRRLWELTPSGEKYVREELGLPGSDPEVEHDVGTLQRLVSGLKDDDVRGFIEEAVKCLQVGALRAAVVFLWSGAIRTLHEAALAKGSKQLSTSIQKHDPKAKAVSSIDHFAYVKDKVFLLAAQDVGVVDKAERVTLEEALDLRNRCGHPGKYRPGPKKASSFIEDVVGIVFPR